MSVKIITDSTSDIRGKEITDLDVEIIPLNVSFGTETYQDGVNLSVEEFYVKLKSNKIFPKTSQPSPILYENIFKEAKKNNDEVVYLSVSSGLSGTINSARIAKDLVDYDGIYIVDTLEAIPGLRLLVHEACKMRDDGRSGKEISDKILELKDHIYIFSMIDTLDYLYKGGRLSRASKIIGNFLYLKPFVDLDQNGKIRMYGKSFGKARAYKAIIESMKKVPIDPNYPTYYFGFTEGEENVNKLIEKVKAEFGIDKYEISQIGLAIGSHIGPGGFCVAYISTEMRK